METQLLPRSLKSSILSSTSLQWDEIFFWVVSAAVEKSRRKAQNPSEEKKSASVYINNNEVP